MVTEWLQIGYTVLKNNNQYIAKALKTF